MVFETDFPNDVSGSKAFFASLSICKSNFVFFVMKNSNSNCLESLFQETFGKKISRNYLEGKHFIRNLRLGFSPVRGLKVSYEFLIEIFGTIFSLDSKKLCKFFVP